MTADLAYRVKTPNEGTNWQGKSGQGKEPSLPHYQFHNQKQKKPYFDQKK